MQKQEAASKECAVRFRKGREPQPITYAGSMDKYLKKTELRTIKQSNNHGRWKKIIDSNLYTPGKDTSNKRQCQQSASPDKAKQSLITFKQSTNDL
jgi:hypothetical protein